MVSVMAAHLSTTAAAYKRTRSQLALSYSALPSLARSPLKDARSVLRNQSNRNMEAVNDSEMDGEEDEILLSPATTKRPRCNGDDGREKEREYKRRRHDSRLSPLPVLPLALSKDSETENKVVLSAGAASPHGKSKYIRARSVPACTSDTVPHLDLSAVAPSPRIRRVGSVPPGGSPRVIISGDLDVELATSKSRPRVSSPSPPSRVSNFSTPTKMDTNPGFNFDIINSTSPNFRRHSQPVLHLNSPVTPVLPIQNQRLSTNPDISTPTFPTLDVNLSSPHTPPNRPQNGPRNSLLHLNSPITPLSTPVAKPRSRLMGTGMGRGIHTGGSVRTGSKLKETLFTAQSQTPEAKNPNEKFYTAQPQAPVRESAFSRPLSPLREGQEQLQLPPSPSKIPRPTATVAVTKPRSKPKPHLPSSATMGGGRVTRSVSLREKKLKEGQAVGKGRSRASEVIRPGVGIGFQPAPPKVVKPASSPAKPSSPSKLPAPLVRASSYSGPSSLSNLSIALERLAMPAPVKRCGTSLGFTPEDTGKGGNGVDPDKGKVTPVMGIGMGRPSSGGGLQRSATVDERVLAKSSSGLPSRSVPSGSGNRRDVKADVAKREIRNGVIGRGRGAEMNGITKYFAPVGSGKINVQSGIVVGGMRGRASTGTGNAFSFRRSGEKASQKTNLPSVAGSPANDGGKVKVGADGQTVGTGSGDEGLAGSGKGKEKEKELWPMNASRRASLASQALSQSLTTPSRPMGPSTRAVRNSYPEPSSSAKSQKVDRDGEEVRVLTECIIFVDVRTDEGDDAGSLFVDMLRGMGAKILQRVGHTCTHIVYKNGLMSTLTRYRLLNEPRPAVVGIAWVVECVEQRRLVDETRYKIDLDGENVAGTNKRRKSKLPKTIPTDGFPRGMMSPASPSSHDAGDDSIRVDMSMDGSSSSIFIDEDHLPPLEKARRRRLGNALIGQP